jgi:hypothetical protein
MNQGMDYAKQHQYAREKEKADRILARYDLAFKVVLGVGFGLCFPLLMILFMLGFSVPLFLFVLVAGGGVIFGAIQIKKRKSARQAKLDTQILNNLN